MIKTSSINLYDRINGLNLTVLDLHNFIAIYTYILYCINNGFSLDNDDIKFLEILEEYSYMVKD